MITSVKWSINNRCNLSCPFCFMHDVKEKPLGFDDMCRVMDKLKELGVEHIDFFGKEPLLDDTIFRLMQYGEENGLDFEYSFISNGKNLKKFASRIKSSPCRDFTLSYDCGEERSFIVDLDILKEFEGFAIELSIDVHRNNVKTILDMIPDFVKAGVTSLYFNPIMPIGSLADNVKSITEEEYEHFCKVVRDLNARPFVIFGVPIEFKRMTRINRYDETYVYNCDSVCSAGTFHAYLNSEGTMFGCNMVSFCESGNKKKSCDFLSTPVCKVESIIRTCGERVCGR